MAWFNVIKGAYPSLQQIDKVLDVGSSETGLSRGTLMYIDGSGTNPVFRVAGATQATNPSAYLYFSLIPQDDFTAGMAGTIGQGVEGGAARVNGLAVGMPMEFETTEFTATIYTVGMLLTVANGGLLTPFVTGTANCVAQVTSALRSRWVNNAIAITGRRTGANVQVLTARTVWVPNLKLS